VTAIAGRAEGGKVWIGGDSAGVGGYSLATRKDPKVFRNGEFLIGYTSSFRMGQFLRYHFSPPRPRESECSYGYMVQTFVSSVRQSFRDHGWLKNESGVESGGCFLVGWRGSLYCIERDFQVAEVSHPYYACGCGEDLVLGSLYTTNKLRATLSPKKRIETALAAAEEFSAGVRAPFLVLSV
jgi:hypothetical protein